MSLQVAHQGVVERGYQFASGQAVDRADNPSPFSAGTLRLQAPAFKARGLDLEAEIPGLVWGTVNIRLTHKLRRRRPDITLQEIDWTSDQYGPGRVAPETFSFARCRLAHGGRSYLGLIYLPHPETKPATNAHRYDVLEILTSQVEGLAYDQPASVICRADAFQAF